MAKSSSNKSKSLTPSKPSIDHFSKFARRANGLSIPKSFRAITAFDAEKRPALFLFDLYAFWEFVCRIDEMLFDVLPDGVYENNSVGKLVDEIEGRWPFSESSKVALEQEYKQALKDIAAGRVSKL